MFMRCAPLFAAIAIAIPATLAAQETTPTASENATATPITIAAAETPSNVAFQPAPRTKRRGSMVGYIENASIQTQFRLRLDGGWDIDSPDRAEFFYAKCGCYRDLAGTPLLDKDSPGPGPGIVTKMNFQQFFALGEYAVSDRFSVFGELPIRSIKPQSFVTGTGSFGNQSGIGDINAGVKLGLWSDEMRDVTVLVRATFPTGDARKGLGTDHASIEPALLYRQDVNDRVAVESQFGMWHPFGGARGPLASDDKFAGNILYYGIGPSFDVVKTDTIRFSPVVELVGWHVLGGFDTTTLVSDGVGSAKGVNIANIKFGARTSFKNSGSLYVGYGVAMTNDVWYKHILRFEYRAGF